VSDIDTAVVDSLKVLDLKWPIREADIANARTTIRYEGNNSLMPARKSLLFEMRSLLPTKWADVSGKRRRVVV
jgi:hypothetical protein